MSTQGDCDLYTHKLKLLLSQLGAHKNHIYKSKEAMFSLKERIAKDFQKSMANADRERNVTECDRVRRLLERKILLPGHVMAGECNNELQYFKDTTTVNTVPRARCLSPSPVKETPALDAIYKTSIFLDPSYNPEKRNSVLTLTENKVLTFSRVHKYKNPFLQKMNETMSVLALYSIAEDVVFRSNEGCKGVIVATRKLEPAKPKETNAGEDSSVITSNADTLEPKHEDLLTTVVNTVDVKQELWDSEDRHNEMQDELAKELRDDKSDLTSSYSATIENSSSDIGNKEKVEVVKTEEDLTDNHSTSVG